MEKINFSGFLELPVFISYKDESGNDKFNKDRACLNPMHIMAYWPSELKDDDGIVHDITKVDCGHYSWLINIPLKEFDKFFNTVDRGFQIPG